MIAAKVQYTVQASFADTNAANIRNVMDALKANPIDGLAYFAHRVDDGYSFAHIVVARDEATKDQISELAEFKVFQSALKGSQPVAAPKQTALDVVGASFA